MPRCLASAENFTTKRKTSQHYQTRGSQAQKCQHEKMCHKYMQ